LSESTLPSGSVFLAAIAARRAERKSASHPNTIAGFHSTRRRFGDGPALDIQGVIAVPIEMAAPRQTFFQWPIA
jgi:hypothetical protein